MSEFYLSEIKKITLYFNYSSSKEKKSDFSFSLISISTISFWNLPAFVAAINLSYEFIENSS